MGDSLQTFTERDILLSIIMNKKYYISQTIQENNYPLVSINRIANALSKATLGQKDAMS